ncbi:MAG: hypothetical protein OEU92_25735, partial [Alphaproteobacteria bacterium]|nr:hypothetical protein [Alphaproteobacteria bacterium]
MVGAITFLFDTGLLGTVDGVAWGGTEIADFGGNPTVLIGFGAVARSRSAFFRRDAGRIATFAIVASASPKSEAWERDSKCVIPAFDSLEACSFGADFFEANS